MKSRSKSKSAANVAESTSDHLTFSQKLPCHAATSSSSPRNVDESLKENFPGIVGSPLGRVSSAMRGQ